MMKARCDSPESPGDPPGLPIGGVRVSGAEQPKLKRLLVAEFPRVECVPRFRHVGGKHTAEHTVRLHLRKFLSSLRNRVFEELQDPVHLHRYLLSSIFSAAEASYHHREVVKTVNEDIRTHPGWHLRNKKGITIRRAPLRGR